MPRRLDKEEIPRQPNKSHLPSPADDPYAPPGALLDPYDPPPTVRKKRGPKPGTPKPPRKQYTHSMEYFENQGRRADYPTSQADGETPPLGAKPIRLPDWSITSPNWNSSQVPEGVTELVCRALAMGIPWAMIAKLTGCSVTIMTGWREKGEAEYDRLHGVKLPEEGQLPAGEADPALAVFLDFFLRTSQAEAQPAVTAHYTILNNLTDDPAAAWKFLQQRFPKIYTVAAEREVASSVQNNTTINLTKIEAGDAKRLDDLRSILRILVETGAIRPESNEALARIDDSPVIDIRPAGGEADPKAISAPAPE